MESESDKRIVIPAKTFERLTAEAQNIRSKGSYFKVNETKLATAVLDLFFEEYADKQRSRLEKFFFDKRSYLKTLIANSTSEEELTSSIDSYLKVSRTRRSAKKSVEPTT